MTKTSARSSPEVQQRLAAGRIARKTGAKAADSDIRAHAGHKGVASDSNRHIERISKSASDGNDKPNPTRSDQKKLLIADDLCGGGAGRQMRISLSGLPPSSGPAEV